ncbi:alcohol oxidase [Mycena metata]|uniref:Alcohol oxidase n=1 Tax=Mycena metata TaxID=1033252 RepID=A0AAD7HJG9_9AGAR|nr:alcohol oxidase [Mycena metata]
MWPFTGTKYPAVSLDEAGAPLEHPNGKTKTYDYIIVGGGTAGCCLASRLSEDPNVSVLLLERGPVHDAWYSRIPLISSDVTSKMAPVVRSPSAPVKAANGQALDVIHAEALGGGSSVNAMLVTRGAVGDFNHWAELGHPSWDYASLKPYFIKSEKSLSQHSDDRGYSGPLVNQTFPDLPYEVQRKIKDVAIAMGFANVDNMNSPTAPVDACGIMDVAINENLQRVSSYHAFLPVEVAQDRRDRLKVCANAVATRIEFEGDVAVGVVFEASDKSVAQPFRARAAKEVVVCCGALGSPQLLLLSGIGRKEDLKAHSLDTVVDLPGVGAHLQDHVGLPLMYEVPLEDTLHYAENSIRKGVFESAKHLFNRKGMMASTLTPMSIFAHSSHLSEKTAKVISPLPPAAVGSSANRPDIEVMPIAHWVAEQPPYKIRKGVFSLLLCVVQPKSLGSVRLASGDPHARPTVDLGFLNDPQDFATFRKGVELASRLAEGVRQTGYPIADLQVPASEKESDVDKFIRAEIRTCFHYTSTCRMARREDGGVVNDNLEVYGVRGLRVCDASVFPCIPSSHTMAPVIAVAERCADLMRAG